MTNQEKITRIVNDYFMKRLPEILRERNRFYKTMEELRAKSKHPVKMKRSPHGGWELDKDKHHDTH